MEAFVFDCARSLRASAHITCFHCFWSNSVSFYRIKIIFNVLREPWRNAKQWMYLFYSAMASLAVAGVFTYARNLFLSLHAWTCWFSSVLLIQYVSWNAMPLLACQMWTVIIVCMVPCCYHSILPSPGISSFIHSPPLSLAFSQTSFLHQFLHLGDGGLQIVVKSGNPSS